MVNRLFQTVIYALTIAFGILTFLNPSPAVSDAVGISFVWAYALCATVGGTLATAASIWPNFKAELIALLPCITAYLVYAVSLMQVLFNRITDPTGPPPAHAPIIISIVAAVFLIWRALYIWGEARTRITQADHHA